MLNLFETNHFQEAAIASRVRPLVSGTIRQQNANANRHTTENNQNTPAGEPCVCSKYRRSDGNNWLAPKKAIHSATPAIDIARPRTRVGKISDMISHAKGA